MRGENNLNFRFPQQCLIVFHYQPPHRSSGAPKTNTNKTQLRGREGTAAEAGGTCSRHSCHGLRIISAFQRRSDQRGTQYSPRGKAPAQRHSQTLPPRQAPRPARRVRLSLRVMDGRSGEALPTRDPAHCEIRPFHNRVAIQSRASTSHEHMSALYEYVMEGQAWG